MNEIIREIGSFTIRENTCSLGSLYTIEYNKIYPPAHAWEFLDLEEAEAFCEQQTKNNKKLFKKRKL